ncbi:hypothetical protein N566_12580 [Streptomycetaceae bacterium MP113-05]|nr:hypothetical protein N566_12580 [Streptomycetaceae bacterium MP113-05]
MLRHAIAPARAYAQIPNAILRHPRLSAEAKTLLAWQLSLTADNRQCLSGTARRAGIGKTAFQRAKRELLAEGYVHEWRVKVAGGRFATVQLVSNVVLTSQEAAELRDDVQPRACNEDEPPAPEPAAAEQVPPGDRFPAAGEPTGRAVGRQPKKNTGENNTQPTSPAPTFEEAEHAPSRTRRAAEAFLRTLTFTEPCLAMSARTVRAVAPLVVPWLRSDLTTEQIHHALTRGIAEVRSPVGVLRWRLEHSLPEAPPAPPPAEPPREPRVAAMRECRTPHTQPRLFASPPGSEEELCADCRASQESAPSPPGPGAGYAGFVAARQATVPSPRRTRPRRARAHV